MAVKELISYNFVFALYRGLEEKNTPIYGQLRKVFEDIALC